jgi:hypothetical protein
MAPESELPAWGALDSSVNRGNPPLKAKAMARLRDGYSRELFSARLRAPTTSGEEKVGHDSDHDDHDYRYYQSSHCWCHLRVRWVPEAL